MNGSPIATHVFVPLLLPWFGPKKYFGWGWTPVREVAGWLAIGVSLVLITVSVILWPGVAGVIAMTVPEGALLAVSLLTGDPPG